jgi:hypothetical protein
MLNFKDDNSPPTPEAVRERKKLLQEIRGEHRPVEANNAMKQNKVRCTVCRLENYIDPVNVSEAGLKRSLVKCECCHVVAHNHVVTDDQTRKIHQIQEFRGLTCFDIMHTDTGKALWQRTGREEKPTHLSRDHSIYRELGRIHGKNANIQKKRKSTDDNSDK